jgi:diguanylate cyclase (GGDEF)-like protein
LTANTLKRYTISTTPAPGQYKIPPNSTSPFYQKFHIALYQRFTALEDRLSKSLFPGKVVYHYFKNLTRLYENFRKSRLDLIVIANTGDIGIEFDLVREIKKHPTLQLIPLILYTPYPDKAIIIEGFRCGADDFLTGFWDDEIIGAKLRMLCYRSNRDIGVNPSSSLPGSAAIEADVNKRIASKEDFAVCYADLDNFKAYNDYYGYVYGDKLIRLTGTIIKDIVLDLAPDGFIGHIGGDDFVFIIPSNEVDDICKNIIDTFDKMIISGYAEEDLRRKFIEVPNRKGQLEQYEIMTISIAVFPHGKIRFNQIGEISHMMADLKKYTKTFSGSNYRIERRRKY